MKEILEEIKRINQYAHMNDFAKKEHRDWVLKDCFDRLTNIFNILIDDKIIGIKEAIKIIEENVDSVFVGDLIAYLMDDEIDKKTFGTIYVAFDGHDFEITKEGGTYHVTHYKDNEIVEIIGGFETKRNAESEILKHIRENISQKITLDNFVDVKKIIEEKKWKNETWKK